MNAEPDGSTKLALVLGGTGKTGRRVVSRLEERGLPVRIGSRSGEPPFDWQAPGSWAPALDDVGAVYITYYPDLAVPGATEAIEAFCAQAMKTGVLCCSFVVHLANHDVTLCAVSRAPLAKLQAFKRRMGWSFPWASSFGSDFNYDFQAAYTEEQQQSGVIEYNFRAMDVRPSPEASKESPFAEIAAGLGTDLATYTRETPGMSAFALEDGVVYHTYSAYARGLDSLWGMYQWLDRAPRGRNESVFVGAGDLRGSIWYRRHDEYNKG